MSDKETQEKLDDIIFGMRVLYLLVLGILILLLILVTVTKTKAEDRGYLRNNNYEVKELYKNGRVYDPKLNPKLDYGREVGNGYREIRDPNTLETKGFYRNGIIYDNKYNYKGYYDNRTIKDNNLNYRRYIDRRK